MKNTHVLILLLLGLTLLLTACRSTDKNHLTVAMNRQNLMVVDGHTLPPEPDEGLNKATLLGIDVNNNGVRDDVERWIYLEMEIQNGYPKIERAIGMQDAKAHQYILSDLENKDDKGVDAITASSDCWTWYEYIKGSEDIGAERRFSLAMEDKVYNTKKRLISYSKFNASLSGRIFGTVPTLQTKYQCTFDIDKL